MAAAKRRQETISVEEARKRLGNLAMDVRDNGTIVTLTRYNLPVAAIVPLDVIRKSADNE